MYYLCRNLLSDRTRCNQEFQNDGHQCGIITVIVEWKVLLPPTTPFISSSSPSPSSSLFSIVALWSSVYSGHLVNATSVSKIVYTDEGGLEHIIDPICRLFPYSF
jgi:hypothetical protein